MYLAEYARLVTGVCNEFNQDSVSGKAKAPVDVSSMCSSGYLHAMEMRRGNEVGNTVMPSLEAAGNNIFQYFLVSAIANARLSRKCTLGEVLYNEHHHMTTNVVNQGHQSGDRRGISP